MRDRTLATWVGVGLAAAVVLALAGSWAGGGTGRWWWGMCPMCPGSSPWMAGPDFGGGGMVLMLLSMLLFWAAVIASLVLSIRWLVSQNSEGRAEGTDALEIARGRYARGEISRAEFERLREDLTHSGRAP